MDLDGGWLHVRNKIELGWRIKTGQERSVPLLPEVVAILRTVIGKRRGGPVFLREKLVSKSPKLVGNRAELEAELKTRIAAARSNNEALSRTFLQGLARKIWWDAGEVKPDIVREVIRADHGEDWSSRSDLPEILATFVRYPSPGRQRRSAHSPADPGPQTNEFQRPGHDCQLHAYTTRNPAPADRAGVAAVDGIACVCDGAGSIECIE